MTKLEQIIARQEETLNSMFDWADQIKEREIGHWKIMYGFTPQDLKDWHSSSIKEILEGVVEIKKNSKKIHREFECNGAHNGKGCYETWCDMETCISKNAMECKGYNKCIDDTINHLEEIIKKL